MNDEMRERLSAYLDGALSESERLAVEAQLARSEDLRLELEALRAVSGAVKGLPRQPLPPGFMARLEARRTSSEKPERTWVFLPPAARPLAFALSTAVVALVVWDKTHGPSDLAAPIVGWDGDKVAVKTAAQAPNTQLDLSGRVSGMISGAAQSAAPEAAKEQAPAAKSLSALGEAKGVGKLALGRRVDAPGKPVEFVEENRVAADNLAGAGGGAAAPAAAPAAAEPQEGENGSFKARSEEERSAINERLYQNLEDQKKKMGIARIIEKDPEKDAADEAAKDTMSLAVPPSAPSVARARSSVLRANTAAVRGGAPATAPAAAPAPALAKAETVAQTAAVRPVVLRSAEALQAAWAGAGLPGDPPAIAFPGQMAVFLAGPEGCGVTSVKDGRRFVAVFYKLEGFSSPTARVVAVSASSKAVKVFPAP